MRAAILLHLLFLIVLVGCTFENPQRRDPAATEVDLQGTEVIKIDYPALWDREAELKPGRVVCDQTTQSAETNQQHRAWTVSRRVVLQIDEPTDIKALQLYADTLELEAWKLNSTSVLQVEKELIDSIGPRIRIQYESNGHVGAIHATITILDPDNAHTDLLLEFLKHDPNSACLPSAKLRALKGTYLAVLVEESRK